MRFYSTQKKSPSVTFAEALFQGLAPDGGLYMPEIFPTFSESEITNLSHMTSAEIGTVVLKKWTEDLFDEKTLQEISEKSLSFPMPLVTVGNKYILELFHGPTMAFKDVAARVLAQMMSIILEKRKQTTTILVATSGDTGGAIAQAFADIKNIRVVILFPKGKVSKLQEEQLTRVEENIFPIAVSGVFDDCQRYVKEAFLDEDLQNLHLTTANSINIGRLIPQIMYYIATFAKLQRENIEFIVPSGNMGNVTAGLMAARMRLPFSSFIIATNANDSVPKYYQTGKYEAQKTKSTLSTAMDIGNPSNFVRILEMFGNDFEEFKDLIKSVSISDRETVATIQDVYRKQKYLMEFHTAVGFAAAEKIGNTKKTQVIIATASPVKFAQEMQAATGIFVDDTEEIKKLQRKEKRIFEVENTYEAVKEIIVKI